MCLGCVGTMFCPVGREACCSCLNNRCCESCVGVDGCIGYPGPLCGCCGNCNLCCYAMNCPACFLADLTVATTGDDKTWASNVTTLVVCGMIVGLFQSAPSWFGVEFGMGKQYDPDVENSWAYFLGTAGQVMEFVLWMYATILFGKAASAIAVAKGYEYEAAECFDNCCPGGACCTSCTCCCAYTCFEGCHYMQVARDLEGTELVTNIVNQGRPESCRCCNCWIRDASELGEALHLDPVGRV